MMTKHSMHCSNALTSPHSCTVSKRICVLCTGCKHGLRRMNLLQGNHPQHASCAHVSLLHPFEM